MRHVGRFVRIHFPWLQIGFSDPILNSCQLSMNVLLTIRNLPALYVQKSLKNEGVTT